MVMIQLSILTTTINDFDHRQEHLNNGIINSTREKQRNLFFSSSSSSSSFKSDQRQTKANSSFPSISLSFSLSLSLVFVFVSNRSYVALDFVII